MAAASWKDLDTRRLALPRRMSRAEMARLAGVSESTITKGLKEGTSPRKEQRQRVELILNAREVAAAEGLDP